jgi:hypothetical protein
MHQGQSLPERHGPHDWGVRLASRRSSSPPYEWVGQKLPSWAWYLIKAGRGRFEGSPHVDTQGWEESEVGLILPRSSVQACFWWNLCAEKIIKQGLKALDIMEISCEENESVIRIVEHRGRFMSGQGMLDPAATWLDQVLQDICHKQQGIGGQWITLAQVFCFRSKGPPCFYSKHASIRFNIQSAN